MKDTEDAQGILRKEVIPYINLLDCHNQIP